VYNKSKRNVQRFAIGEIVRIAEGSNEGCICIVDEIVNDALGDEWRGGRYSLYGWEQPNPSDRHHPDYPRQPGMWYFGDYIGKELETTGGVDSAEEVLDYGKRHDFKGGYWDDIQFIVNNLGKTGTLVRKRGFFSKE